MVLNQCLLLLLYFIFFLDLIAPGISRAFIQILYTPAANPNTV